MKRLILIVLVAVAAGLAAFGLTRRMAPTPEPGDELLWLVSEFRLNAEQARQIEALHAAYEPVCIRHCAQIFAVRTQLAELEQDGERDSPAYRDGCEQMERLVEACGTSTRAHLQQVAAVMPPAEAKRYLALVEPKLSQHAHVRPFGLK